MTPDELKIVIDEVFDYFESLTEEEFHEALNNIPDEECTRTCQSCRRVV